MSEDTNDIISDDASMDNSEFEVSGIIEETIEIVVTESIQPKMSSEEFEEKLTDFFTKHKKSKLKLVPRIAFEFKGQEAAVLEHLNNKYVLGLVTGKSQKKVAVKSGEHADQPQHIVSPEAAKPKSKKKLVMIIIIVVVLAGLGVTGFMMKDKLMGTTSAEHGSEHGAAKEEHGAESHVVATGHGAEVAPVVEAILTEEEAVDSVNTIVTDSVVSE